MQCKLILSWNQQLLWNDLKFSEIFRKCQQKTWNGEVWLFGTETVV